MKQGNITALALLSVLWLGLASAATADEADSDLWLLAKYDADGDQAISMNEVSKKREKLFSYMDSNANGHVSFAEYRELDRKKRELLLKARFNKLDGDSDGALSKAEYSSYFGSFDRFDHNGDGRITATEMADEELDNAAPAAQDDSDTHCLLWFCVKTSL